MSFPSTDLSLPSGLQIVLSSTILQLLTAMVMPLVLFWVVTKTPLSMTNILFLVFPLYASLLQLSWWNFPSIEPNTLSLSLIPSCLVFLHIWLQWNGPLLLPSSPLLLLRGKTNTLGYSRIYTCLLLTYLWEWGWSHATELSWVRSGWVRSSWEIQTWPGLTSAFPGVLPHPTQPCLLVPISCIDRLQPSFPLFSPLILKSLVFCGAFPLQTTLYFHPLRKRKMCLKSFCLLIIAPLFSILAQSHDWLMSPFPSYCLLAVFSIELFLSLSTESF